MHILVTNDDGVFAPGLLALAKELRKLGTVTILAPDHNWSATGHVKTLSRPMRMHTVTLADGSEAMSSDGSPSDCVMMAALGMAPTPIDLVVAGINTGENVGHDMTYSGTVTAAMEAAIQQLPALAISLDTPEKLDGALDFSAAAVISRKIAEMVLEHKLPKYVLLNVNIPYLKEEEMKGWRVSRQGMRIYHDELVKREDPRGRPYYWIGGQAPTGVDEQGTDYSDLAAGYVSITPLQMDMTAVSFIDDLKTWNW